MAMFDEQDGTKLVDVGVDLFESVANFIKKTLELAGEKPLLTAALIFVLFVGKANVKVSKLFNAKVG